MADENKNDTKKNSEKHDNEIKESPQKQCVEETAEDIENADENDIKNKTESVNDGCFEIDEILNNLKSKIINSVRSAVEEGAEESMEGLMSVVKPTETVKCSTEEKSNEKTGEMINFSPSDLEDEDAHFGDEEQWSYYKDKFERCLIKLKVTYDDLKNKPFEELCDVLVQPTALYRERKRFYLTQRKPNESMEEFIERLTDLSSTCQFGKRQDATIADKVITSELKKRRYSIGRTTWMELTQEVDTKKVLEIVQKEGDSDDMDTILGRCLYGGCKKNSTKTPPHLAEMILNEIMETNLSFDWNEIAGLDFPKSIIKESIVWPMVRPDIFTGLRTLPKAMLLFGPPGTGKTMIAKCIASQSKSTFFYVSASTMASKWHGESEKLVRALFAIAAEHQPAVIFFDEVDSLLSERSNKDHEASRRVKTEFMIQLDGAATKNETRVLFIGATNRPQDLDEAVRRRFVKRLYIPLPDLDARKQLLNILLKNHRSNLSGNDVNEIATMTNEFSGADIKWLCQDAAMEPIRSIPADRIREIQLEEIRPMEMNDFLNSLKRIRPSVASTDLTALVEWDRLYGSSSERLDSDYVHFMYS